MCMPGKWCLEKFEMCFTFLIMKPSPCALVYDLRQCILPIQLPQPNVSPFHTFRHHPTQLYLLQTREIRETLQSQGHVFSVITHHKPQIGISSRELLLMEEILHQLMLKYVVYPIIYRVLHIPGGAGVLPSTVCPWISETYLLLLRGSPFWPIKMSSNRYVWYCWCKNDDHLQPTTVQDVLAPTKKSSIQHQWSLHRVRFLSKRCVSNVHLPP